MWLMIIVFKIDFTVQKKIKFAMAIVFAEDNLKTQTT